MSNLFKKKSFGSGASSNSSFKPHNLTDENEPMTKQHERSQEQQETPSAPTAETASPARLTYTRAAIATRKPNTTPAQEVTQQAINDSERSTPPSDLPALETVSGETLPAQELAQQPSALPETVPQQPAQPQPVSPHQESLSAPPQPTVTPAGAPNPSNQGSGSGQQPQSHAQGPSQQEGPPQSAVPLQPQGIQDAPRRTRTPRTDGKKTLTAVIDAELHRQFRYAVARDNLDNHLMIEDLIRRYCLQNDQSNPPTS